MTRPARRIVLREPGAADAEAFVAAARASRRLHRPWITAPLTPEAYATWLQRVAGLDRRTVLVRDAASGGLAGVIALSQIVRGPFQSAYLGYFAFAPLAGRGYMSAGLAAVVREAFGPMKLHRLEANIQPGNTASIALVRRLGFRLEGFSPRYLKIGGRWRDHERWAILAR